MRFHNLKSEEIRMDKSMIKVAKNSHKEYLVAKEKKMHDKKNTDVENVCPLFLGHYITQEVENLVRKVFSW